MSKKILVAEDSDDSREFMKMLLELSGYDVIEAVNGEEAVEAFESEAPDLILMDMSMPVMDGIAATRLIRKIKKIADLPIIAVTAFGASYYRIAIEAGCNALIAKPVEFKTLQPILDQYLS